MSLEQESFLLLTEKQLMDFIAAEMKGPLTDSQKILDVSFLFWAIK